jgi:hypothetical protein
MIRLLGLAALVVAMFVAASPATPSGVEAVTYASQIQLINGWLPEGIAAGDGVDLYSGSRRNGAIYKANIETGQGSVIVTSQAGRMAVGMKFDTRTKYLYVAGGSFGAAHVYDTTTGYTVQSYQFVTSGGGTFVNDVIVTNAAAYFTDSMRPVIYRVALDATGKPAATFTTISLSGDYVHRAGFNLNGIVATPAGDRLIVVQSGPGLLLSVNAATGVATTIDLGGYSVSAGDGLWLEGSTLYVVRNNLNTIAEILMAPSYLSGTLIDEIRDSRFDVPTTAAVLGGGLYAVNARFAAGNDPANTYTIVRVER